MSDIGEMKPSDAPVVLPEDLITTPDLIKEIDLRDGTAPSFIIDHSSDGREVIVSDPITGKVEVIRLEK